MSWNNDGSISGWVVRNERGAMRGETFKHDRSTSITAAAVSLWRFVGIKGLPDIYGMRPYEVEEKYPSDRKRVWERLRAIGYRCCRAQLVPR